MKKNGEAARFEVCIARIPEHVTDKFINDGDAGAFRNACRTVGVPEDVIDTQIRFLERVTDLIPEHFVLVDNFC